jgi:Fur family iron response transcriptional regulator
MNSVDVEALLKSRDIRPTRHRVLLGRLLFDGRDRHVTAEQVHLEVEQAGEHVALATVYNTLNQLRTAGLLNEVVIEAGRVIYDTNTTDHWHLFDETTGELRDLPAGRVVDLPPLPEGSEVAQVSVVVRVRSAG